MLVSEWLRKEEELRRRKGMDRRVLAALDSLNEALSSYMDLILRLDEAAEEVWPNESGPIRPPQSSNEAGIGVSDKGTVGRHPKYDEFLRRDVYSDLRGLERHIDHIAKRVVKLLRGGKAERVGTTLKDRIKADLELGYSPETVAARNGLSRSTVRRVATQAGNPSHSDG